MTRIFTIAAATTVLITGTAFAEPRVMTEEEMDSVVAAGFDIVTPNKGNLVWAVENPTSGNPAGKAGLAAAGGLTKAIGAGGLTTR